MKAVRAVMWSCVSMLMLLSSGAQAQLVPSEFNAEPVKIVRDPDLGGVLFDASGTKKIFPSISRPREFASYDDLFEFLQKELFATPLMEDGKITGVRLVSAMNDEAFMFNELGETVRVGCDPTGEFLAGEFGYIVIAGEKIFIPRQPCWEIASKYLASRLKPGFIFAEAGGGCSGTGYCVANATWGESFPFIYQKWGSSAFQSQSQIKCRKGSVFFMTCTSVNYSQNGLSARVALTSSVGGQVIDVRTKGGSRTLRVDVAEEEWKAPWSAPGVVYTSAGICGTTLGQASDQNIIHTAAASSVEAVSMFSSAVRQVCAGR